MGRYVIYMHKNKINGKVYIGQTCQNPPEKRWANGKGYSHNPYFTEAIEKYGWENFTHEILETLQTLDESNKAEQKWIKYFNSTNRNYGYNLSEGGKSNSGFKHSQKTIQKMKDSAFKRPVICLETQQVFSSITEAAQATNNMLNNIRDCCTGRQKTTKGLHWQFYDNKEKIKTIAEIEKNRNKTQCKAVICIELGIEYKSAAEAGRILNINNKNIGACCLGKRLTAGGYHWVFKGD